MQRRLKAALAHISGRKDADAVAPDKNRGTADEMLHKSVETDVNKVDFVQTHGSQGLIDKCLTAPARIKGLTSSTERVHLEPFVKEPHTNPRVAKAQKALQESTEKLEATLRKYADKCQKFPNIEDKSVKSAMKVALGNQSNSGAAFGSFIEGVLADQEEQKGTISGKVAGYMAWLYPVASLALGLISFSADVSQILPTTKLNSYVTGRPLDSCLSR